VLTRQGKKSKGKSKILFFSTFSFSFSFSFCEIQIFLKGVPFRCLVFRNLIRKLEESSELCELARLAGSDFLSIKYANL